MAGMFHQVTIGAHPEKLYHAITTEEEPKSWWAVD